MDRNRNSINRPICSHWMVATFTVLNLMLAKPLFAGGYVDGNVVLEPATAINTGTVSVSPTFNNDQFNDKILVGTVNNDQIRTPSTADPVSTVSGNNYHDETDFSIRGRNALNYVFTRTYNSQSSTSRKLGDLGYGWVHSYGMKLMSNDFGRCPNCTPAQAAENGTGKTSSVTYTDERGGEHLYLINETTHGVTPPAGEFEALSLNSNPSQGWHTLRFRNGINYIFETSGDLLNTPGVTARLKIIGNDFGDQLTLNYDANGRLVSIKDNLNIPGRSDVGLTFNYRADNRLQDVTDWSGRKWLYAYDVAGNLQSVSDPLNHTRNYTYTGDHLLHEVIEPLQRNGQAVKTTFNYYQNGRVFNYHNALNQAETLDYDLYRKTTRVTDPRGGIRAYAYDANGRMTKLTEPDGGILLFENQGDAIRSKKYDALGYATTYSYRNDKAFTGQSDSFGNVTREQDALNQTVDTTYGPDDQIATVKDQRGTVTTTSFYANTAGCALNGKPQSVTLSTLNGSSNVKLRDYCWNADGTLATLTEYLEPGNATRKRITAYSYEAGSNGLKVADINVTGSGQTLHTHFTYDALGRKQTETFYRRTSPTDATLLALTTTYAYDALDRPVKVTDPEGRIRETIFDANGQVAQEKTWYPTTSGKAGCAAPAGGYVICTDATHQYDAADRRIATTDVFGKTTQFAYDEAGNLIKITDANSHVTRYEYDAMNRKTAVIDANDRRTETKYNLRGEAISITNANGETSQSRYDELGRLTKVINPLGFETRYQYDANGNQTCIIDANATSAGIDPGHQPVNADGCTESRVYDELSRLTQSKDVQGNITAYGYDLLGNRTAITDAEGHTTSFHYDDLGRLTETVDPLIETPTDKTQTFVYDEVGNLIEATDRKGQVSRHTYDRLNRLTQTDHLADNSHETHSYDAFGDLIETANASVTYSYSYTAKHQLKSKTDSRLNKTLSWTYDPAGNIDSKTDYQHDVTDYQYDSANRLTAESNPNYLQVSYHYDGAGRLLDRILSNGVKTQYDYDAGGRLTHLKNTSAGGQIVNDTSYSRDRIGNILSQTEATGSGQTAGITSYTYDPEYRLLSADYPGAATDEAFGYDKVGNRKTYTSGSLMANANTRYYQYNSGNRLLDQRTGSPTGTVYESYQYDDNGSLTQIGGNRSLTLSWDVNNRPSSIGGTSYQYDPAGYRIDKSGSQSRHYYLEGEHLEAAYDGSGNLHAQYFRGSIIDEVVNGYQRDSSSKLVNYSFHHDALQSVLGQSGHEGSILATQAYGAFGNSKNQTGTSSNQLKYTGREEDSESGCYYYRARIYCPNMGGRFISEDPIGLAGGINRYVYANNNPVNANDPTGNITFTMTGQVSLPGWISDAAKNIGLTNLGGEKSIQFGTAESFPLFDGAERDSGILFSGGAGGDVSHPLNGGNNLYGIGSLNLSIGISPGSVKDLAGRDNVMSLTFPGVSGGLSFNAQTGSYSGLSFGTGAGFSFGAQETLTGVYSMKNGFIGYDNNSSAANGGFVLYPNKSNTNQMQSVYKK